MQERVILHCSIHLFANATMTFSSSGAFRTSSMSSAMRCIISSLAPRVVMAAVPRRIPDVWKAERLSNGTMFLLTVMSAATSAFSATLPVRSGYFRRSTSIEWLSVPPLTIPKSATDEVICEYGCILLYLSCILLP